MTSSELRECADDARRRVVSLWEFIGRCAGMIVAEWVTVRACNAAHEKSAREYEARARRAELEGDA